MRGDFGRNGPVEQAGARAECGRVCPLIEEKLFLGLRDIHQKLLPLRANTAREIALVRRQRNGDQQCEHCQNHHEFD